MQQAMEGKLDAGNVTMSTSVTQAGFAADARQLNPTIDGTLANSVAGLMNSVGGIRAGTHVTDTGGKDVITIPVKTSEVYKSLVIAANGDTHVWGGHVVGVACYLEDEYVKVKLSSGAPGAIRINYIYVHV